MSGPGGPRSEESTASIMWHSSNAPARMQGNDAERQVAPGDLGETRVAHAPGEVALRGKASDALVQIAVGLGVARHDPTEQRQRALRVGVVGARRRRRRHLAELQAI